MFDSFKAKIAKRAFKTLFKDFLKELNEQQIKIDSDGFTVVDAQLDLQGINSKFRGSPYKFISGGISELKFKISWFSLFSNDIVISLSGLTIDLEQQETQDSNISPTGRSLMESQLFESITCCKTPSSLDLDIPEEYLSKNLQPTQEEEYLTKIIQGLVSRIKFELENLTVSFSFPQPSKKDVLLLHFPNLKYENLTKIPIDSNFPEIYDFNIICSKFSIQLLETERFQKIQNLQYENTVIFGDNENNQLSVKFVPGDFESILIIDWDMPSIHSIFTPTQVKILNEILKSLNYTSDTNYDTPVSTPMKSKSNQLSVPSPFASPDSSQFKSIEIFPDNFLTVEFNIKIENNTSFNILYEDISTKEIWKEFYSKLDTKSPFPKITHNHVSLITENFNLNYVNVKNDNKIQLNVQNLFLVDQNFQDNSKTHLLKFQESKTDDMQLSIKNKIFHCKISPVCLLLDLNIIEKLNFLLKPEPEAELFDSPTESDILTYEEEPMKYLIELDDFKISIKYQHQNDIDLLTLNLKKFSFDFKSSWSLFIESCFIEIETNESTIPSRILDIPNKIVVRMENSESITKLFGNLDSNDLGKSMIINPNGLSVSMSKNDEETIMKSTISVETDILSAEFNLSKYNKIQIMINELMKSLTPKAPKTQKKTQTPEYELLLNLNILKMVDFRIDLVGKKFNPKVNFIFNGISIEYSSMGTKQKISVESRDISIIEEINGTPRDFISLSPKNKTDLQRGLSIHVNQFEEQSISKSDVKININALLVYYYPELNLQDNWISLLTSLFAFEIDPNIKTSTKLEMILNDTVMMLQVDDVEYCGLLSIKTVKFETTMDYPTDKTVYKISLDDLNLYLHNNFKDKLINEEIPDIHSVLEIELKKIGFKKFGSLNTTVDDANLEIILFNDETIPNSLKFSHVLVNIDIHRDSLKIFGDLMYSLQEKQKEVIDKERERILNSIIVETEEEKIIQTDKTKPIIYEENTKFYQEGNLIFETIHSEKDNFIIKDSKYLEIKRKEKSQDSPLFKSYFSTKDIINLKLALDSIDFNMKFLEGEIFSESSTDDDHFYMFCMEDLHVDYEFSDYSTKIGIQIQNFFLDQYLHQKKNEILKFYSPKKLAPFPNMLDLSLIMTNKEKKLSSYLTLLPIHLNVEPNFIKFIYKFSKGSIDELSEKLDKLEADNSNDQKESTKEEEFIIEHFKSNEIKLVIDWVPETVNFKKMFKGKWVEIFNISSLYGVKISLKPLDLVDMYGFSELFEKMKYNWVSTSLVAGTTTSLLFGFGPISHFSGLVSLLIFEPLTKTKKWIKLAFEK